MAKQHRPIAMAFPDYDAMSNGLHTTAVPSVANVMRQTGVVSNCSVLIRPTRLHLTPLNYVNVNQLEIFHTHTRNMHHYNRNERRTLAEK
jgi:hypothetical protein